MTDLYQVVKWIAGTTAIIGISGLLALQTYAAQTVAPPSPTPPPPVNDNTMEFPRPGMTGGARPIGSPFAAPGGGKAMYDDEDEDEDFYPEYPVGGGARGNTPGDMNIPGANRFGGAADNPSAGTESGFTPNRRGAPGSVSLGGGTANNVITKNTTPSISIDSESGQGSSEVVTDFNYPDADILDIAKSLGKLTGKNFIFDKDVKGRISIVSNSPIRVSDAWNAFLTALDMTNFALVPAGKYIRIVRNRDARDKNLRVYSGDYAPDTDALVTRIFRVKYLTPEEVARTFRSLMPATTRITPYDQTNTLIVTDTGSNIAKVAKFLEILDVEGYDAGIEVIVVKYASASELSKLIDTLLPGTGGMGGPPGAPRFGAGGSRFNARRTKEGGVVNAIISDERTNSLIVHANAKGVGQVRELVTKLDLRSPATATGGKVHVYYLQFADAEQIANTLNNLTSGAKAAAPPGGGAGTGIGVNPTQANLFEGSIKVSPDKATNSLVITGSPTDYTTVQRVINRLDIPRDQVYTEIVIMEVSMNRNFSWSSNIASPANKMLSSLPKGQDLVEYLGNPAAMKGLTIPFGTKGTTELDIGGKKIAVPNWMALIKLLQVEAHGNVLATPQITALDNTEAVFEAGDKIPVPTSNATNGAVSSGVTRENVSLSISIKPQINKMANFVKLDVKAKLEDLSDQELPTQVAGLAKAITTRTANTSLVVANDDTVVLGGMIRDKRQETVSKVPLLGDIPVLGWLFKSKTSTMDKTNLLIFLTPHIVKQYEMVRTILDKKLKERDDFLEAHAGGEDPLRPYRDNIIRDLPNVKNIQNSKAKRSVSLDEDDDILEQKPETKLDSVKVQDAAPKPQDSAKIQVTIPPEPSPATPPGEPAIAPSTEIPAAPAATP